MNEIVLKRILDNYTGPAYIYDINILKNRIKYLKQLLNGSAKICYAIKANTFIIKDIENEIDRFEVCSDGEYYICEQSKLDYSKILISGVYKTEKFIDKIINENEKIGYYTIESKEQLNLLNIICKKYNKTINVMIRLTSGNQFGITKEEVENIIKNRNKYNNLNITGLQYFSGTQKKLLKKLQKEIDSLDEFFTYLKENYQYEAKEFEFGAGFPVNYFIEDKEEFNEVDFICGFAQILNNMKFKGEKIIELGRSIVASCGEYITKVVDKKTNQNGNYAILDGGMNHLVYYGQSMAMKIPKHEIYPYRENSLNEKWNLCGSLCTANDIIVKQILVNDLQIGDIFIFKNTGAYCSTEGISLFLSRELPKILILNEEKELIEYRNNYPIYKLNMKMEEK